MGGLSHVNVCGELHQYPNDIAQPDISTLVSAKYEAGRTNKAGKNDGYKKWYRHIYMAI